MSSGSGETSTNELAAGTILQDRYRVVRPLGKGGMGAVYEALDLRLDATVAIKETFSTDDHLRKQFEREARMLAHLHHPSLPRVSDYFTEGQRAFLVMQFIEGVDLARIMAQQPGPFPLSSVVAWADQLLDALVYLHSRDRQVIHRDIKPHNLKLTPDGKIALLDFGLAKAQQHREAGATSSAAIFGYTRQYAPLEQIQDLATGPRSDIYALGATLYHLLTGVKPPDALTRAAALVQGRPDPLRPANEVHWAIGTEIALILKRAMAQSPEHRYASANDFRKALAGVGRIEQPEVAPQLAAEPETNVATCDAHQARELSDVISTPDAQGGYRGRAIAAVVILATAGAIAALYHSDLFPAAPGTSQPKTETAQPSSAALQLAKSSRTSLQRNETGATSQVPRSANTVATDPARGNAATSSAGLAGPDQSDSRTTTAAHPSARKQNEGIPEPKMPSIRFPAPDLPRSYPAPVPVNSTTNERSATNGSASQNSAPASEPREPEILRARDGTQIIRLPDGSTRVFRPGERTH